MLVWRGGRLIWCRGAGHVTSATWALAGVAVLLGGLEGWACRRPAPAVPPPPEVSVLTVAPETVSAHYEFVGEAAASRRVEVRSQVTGVILARPYAEGTDVEIGRASCRESVGLSRE